MKFWTDLELHLPPHERKPRAAARNAYSCEAYARVIARANGPAERRALATEYGNTGGITDERVDPDEVASIVAEAASARNGWKVILKRCAPRSKPRRGLQQLRANINTDGA